MDKPTDKRIAITFTLPEDLKLGARAQRILQLRFEHPDWSQERIGQEVGVSRGRVQYLLSHPKVLEAFPHIGRQWIKNATPQNTKAYIELGQQNDNLAVKEKALAKMLSETKVLDAGATLTVRGEITLRDVRELREIVQSAVKLPENVIEAELVDPEKE